MQHKLSRFELSTMTWVVQANGRSIAIFIHVSQAEIFVSSMSEERPTVNFEVLSCEQPSGYIKLHREARK